MKLLSEISDIKDIVNKEELVSYVETKIAEGNRGTSEVLQKWFSEEKLIELIKRTVGNNPTVSSESSSKDIMVDIFEVDEAATNSIWDFLEVRSFSTFDGTVLLKNTSGSAAPNIVDKHLRIGIDGLEDRNHVRYSIIFKNKTLNKFVSIDGSGNVKMFSSEDDIKKGVNYTNLDRLEDLEGDVRSVTHSKRGIISLRSNGKILFTAYGYEGGKYKGYVYQSDNIEFYGVALYGALKAGFSDMSVLVEKKVPLKEYLYHVNNPNIVSFNNETVSPKINKYGGGCFILNGKDTLHNTLKSLGSFLSYGISDSSPEAATTLPYRYIGNFRKEFERDYNYDESRSCIEFKNLYDICGDKSMTIFNRASGINNGSILKIKLSNPKDYQDVGIIYYINYDRVFLINPRGVYSVHKRGPRVLLDNQSELEIVNNIDSEELYKKSDHMLISILENKITFHLSIEGKYYMISRLIPETGGYFEEIDFYRPEYSDEKYIVEDVRGFQSGSFPDITRYLVNSQMVTPKVYSSIDSVVIEDNNKKTLIPKKVILECLGSSVGPESPEPVSDINFVYDSNSSSLIGTGKDNQRYIIPKAELAKMFPNSNSSGGSGSGFNGTYDGDVVINGNLTVNGIVKGEDAEFPINGAW